MQRISRVIASGLATAGIYLMSAGGIYDTLVERMTGLPEPERMKNVLFIPEGEKRGETLRTFSEDTFSENSTAEEAPSAEKPTEEKLPVPTEPPEAAEEAEGTENTTEEIDGEKVLETTIEGGMRIKNETGYWVDAAKILAEGPDIALPSEGAQILIIHTHSSEAYTQAGLDRYEASDSNRTEDTQFNIVRIGDELTKILSEAGLNVIHDRGIYDYPSYTGSYTRSGEAVEQYLESCPGIKIVLDIHRDALGSDGTVYKTMAEEDGVCASQIMLLVGTDESGLEHPGWRSNLALAVYLQNAVNTVNPTLMRPVDLVQQRYNQQLTPGSLIVEVGSSGNTLQEALAAIRLFGKAAAPALCELVETDAE